jgi:hypothetical protein
MLAVQSKPIFHIPSPKNARGDAKIGWSRGRSFDDLTEVDVQSITRK